MPFCISNNTALDSVTVSQEQASLGTALTLPPLSSQLWTLPLVNGPQKIHISVQRIGSKLSKSCFTTALSVNVTKPGKLGTIHLRDPQRTLSVSLDIQKSMRVITIEEVNKKRLFSKPQEKDTIQYLLQRRRDPVRKDLCGGLSDAERDRLPGQGGGRAGTSFRSHPRRRQGRR